MSTTPQVPTRWAAPAWLTVAVIAFGALLRSIAMAHQEAIAVDSVRYLSFASNWLNGKYFTLGPTGLREFPDLGYPLLVSFFIPTIGDPIRAGQVVSWVMGVGTLFLIYRIARTCYGPLVAFYATLLAAVAQPLIVASAQVQTEATYLFWILAALDMALVCAIRPTATTGMLLGFSCGMAYLTRGIGILVLPLALVFLWWAYKRGGLGAETQETDPVALEKELTEYQASLSVGAGWTGAVAGILLMWAVPVVAYQTMLTATYGGFTLSDQAIWHVGGLSGSVEAASDDVRLEGALTPDGGDYALNAWFEAGRPGGGLPSLGAVIVRYLKNWVALLYYIPEELLDPLTVILIALGVLGSGGRPRLPRTAGILCWWLVPYVIFQPLFLTLGRYLLPAVPILLIWAGRGVVALQEWAIGRWLHAHPKATLADLAQMERVVFVALFLLYLPNMVWPTTHVEPRYQNLEAKAAGEWLRITEAEGGVFASGPVAGYYAGLEPNLVLPAGDLNGVLRMAEAKGVRYLLIDERKVPRSRPQLAELLYDPPNEIPSSLRLLNEINAFPGYRVRIFEIQRAGFAMVRP